MEMLLKNRPVFVIGTGRCGTTLLTDLIQGENIHCLKERQVLSRVPELGNQHIFNLLYRGDISEQEFLEFFRATRLPILTKYPDDEIYCEKIPHGQWAIDSIKKVFPQAKFIEIYREGKDTVQSMLNVGWYAPNDTRPRWLPKGDLDDWYAMNQFEKCCVRLTHTIRFTVENIDGYSAEDYMAFSYEELMAIPKTVLERMEAFTGTTFNRDQVKLKPSLGNWKKWSHKQLEVFHQIQGEQGKQDQIFLGYGTDGASTGKSGSIFVVQDSALNLDEEDSTFGKTEIDNDQNIVNLTIHGGQVSFSIDDKHSKHWFQAKRYSHEQTVTKLLGQELKNAKVFADIGAHLGWYTCIASKLMKNGVVYSFEMDESIVHLLRKNVQINQVKNIEIYHAAVTDVTGSAHYIKQSGYPGSEIYPPPGLSLLSKNAIFNNNSSFVTVDSISMDDFFDNQNIIPDVFKIDVEGAEIQVLNGMQAILQNHKPKLFIEVHSDKLQQFGSSADEVVRMLLEYGYSVFEIVEMRQHNDNVKLKKIIKQSQFVRNTMLYAYVDDFSTTTAIEFQQDKKHNNLSQAKNVNIFVLVKDRKEFTELTLKYLYEFTDFSLVYRLVFVNDGSTDGADQVCQQWIEKNGIGELINIQGGSVTNALFYGTKPYLNDPVKYVVKLDNDMIVSEDWLQKLFVQAQKHEADLDIIGFTVVNEFFPSSPEEVWAARLPEEYKTTIVPYTGGNFIMNWEKFKAYRHLGVKENPEHYIEGSISELHNAMSQKGLLRIGVINPHLPVFKLDKVIDSSYDDYQFFTKRNIDRQQIEDLIEKYYSQGVSRKRQINQAIVNDMSQHIRLKKQTASSGSPSLPSRSIAITGMHRSGTSMVARLLNLVGVYLGPEERMIPPKPDNPAGFWENLDFVHFNDQLLISLGGGWDYPPTDFDKDWINQESIQSLKNKADKYIQTFNKHQRWGWKDPRTSLTLPFWDQLLPNLKVVVCLRNPLEVAASLQKRNYSSIPFGLKLWLAYNKRLLQNSSPDNRIVTHYEAYIANPQKELKRVLDYLGITVSEETISQAAQTVSKSLRHSEYSSQDIRKWPYMSEVADLYEALCREAGPGFSEKSTYAVIRPPTPLTLTSIIILTHNQLEYTKLCLKSIEQHTPEPHELIIVDNGSTDDTPAYLRQYATTHNNVRIIFNEENKGFATGNNQGLAIANGDYVLLLNNDTIVTEGWLSYMLDVFSHYPNTGIVGPVTNNISGPQKIQVDYEHVDRIHQFAQKWSANHTGQATEIFRVVGFALLAKREVIDRIGGLDERYGSGNFEDDDFCIRAAMAGFKSRIAQAAFIHHFGSQTFRGLGIDYKQKLEWNWELFKAKWNIPQAHPYGTYNIPISQDVDPSTYFIPLPDEANVTPLVYDPAHDPELLAAQEKMKEALAPGQAALEANNFDGAVREFAAATEQHPDLAAAHVALGNTLLALGRLEEAVEPLRRAAELVPGEASLHNQLGQTLYRLDRQDEAEAAFNRAREANPGDVESLLNLIDLYKGQKRLKEAMTTTRQALQQAPDNYDVLVAYALLMLDTGDMEAAEMAWEKLYHAPQNHPGVIALLTTLVRKGSRKVTMHTLLGWVETAQEEEDWSRAITLLKSVLGGAQGPAAEIAALWNSLGYNHFRAGNPVEAMIAFESGLNIDPQNLDILSNLADFHLQQEQFDQATDYINRALAVDPYDANTLMLLGHAAINLGELDTALMAYQRVQEVAPHTEGINDVVNELLGMGVEVVAPAAPSTDNNGSSDLSAEMAAFEAELLGDKTDFVSPPTELTAQIDAAQHNQDWPLAIELLEQAIPAASPTDAADLWNRLGLSRFMAGQPEQAEEAFNQAIKLDPANVAAFNNLTDLYLQQEQFDQATEYINRALGVNPNDVNTLMQLGNVAVQLEELDTALMAFQKVQTLAPETEGVAEVVGQLEGLV